MVEYLPLQSRNKPFKYKGEWFTRNELVAKYPELDFQCSQAILNYK